MYKKNPYTWDSRQDATTVESKVLDVIVEKGNGTLDRFDNKPVDLFIPMLTKNVDSGISTNHYFVKPSNHLMDSENIRYHPISIPRRHAAFVRIKPQGDHQLRVYVGASEFPTSNDSIISTVVPKKLSCENGKTSEDSLDCDSDHYTIRIPKGLTGLHYIGIQYLRAKTINDTADDVRRADRKRRRKIRSLEKAPCVKVKDPPTTPPRVVIPEYNANVDVNYTLSLSMGSCLYWSSTPEEWTDEGCKVITPFFHFSSLFFLFLSLCAVLCCVFYFVLFCFVVSCRVVSCRVRLCCVVLCCVV